MAKSKNEPKAESSTAMPALAPRPRLHKMTIKNFRCISTPVTIELDDIVVLVGPNNVGKSTILKAYELIMNDGSKDALLSTDDFPGRKPNPEALPEVELETVVFDNSPGEKWIRAAGGEMFVRERWIWKAPGEQPVRQGFDVANDSWSDERPWGAANVAKARRPRPHRLSAFDTPEDAAEKVFKLIMVSLEKKAKQVQKGESGEEEKASYNDLLQKVRDVHAKLVEASKDHIDDIQSSLSTLISEVFPEHEVKFEAFVDDDMAKNIGLFKGSPVLRMGPKDGYQSRIQDQGSGAQRTLMWLTSTNDSPLKILPVT